MPQSPSQPRLEPASPCAKILSERLSAIRQAVASATSHSPLAGAAPELIAVSKRQPEAKIDAALALGLRQFGENRWQDAFTRWRDRKLLHPDLVLHFIGPIQRNKATEIVGFFDVIHSLDRPALADSLAKEMAKQNRRLPCFIQINTGEEPQKAGIFPAEADAFIQKCRDVLRLPVTGLMCLPPQGVNPAPHFAYLHQLAARNGLPHLSMGMSDDYAIATRLGATHLRVGSALFGEREG